MFLHKVGYKLWPKAAFSKDFVVPITQQQQLLQGYGLPNAVIMIHHLPKSKNDFFSTICWRVTTDLTPRCR